MQIEISDGVQMLNRTCSILLISNRINIGSMMSSARRFISGVISFFVLLKTLSHSVDIAGIERVSQAYG